MPKQPPTKQNPVRLAAGALTLAAAVFTCNIAFSQQDAAVASDTGAWSPEEEITAEEIKKDLFWLADDARQGRSVTSDGINEAADFIAERFETLGLKPLEGLDGYFQPFDLPFGSELVKEKTTLAAKGLKETELGKNFMPLAWSAPGTFEGELAFAGYGINSQEHNYNDFADIDVTGKVVLVMNFEPHDKDGKSRFSNSDRPSREGRLFSKARAAQDAGAAAVLIVNPPMHHGEDEAVMEFGRGSRRTDIPVFSIDRMTAQNLLRASGLPNLRQLQRDIDAEGQPVKAEPKTPVVVSGGFEAQDRTLDVKNVVGVLPGKKTDEYIVVGGHYDHVGMGEYGSSYGREIHNGADDNGSGTVTVLALAEAFAKSPEKPERSIIFMTFTAEELGLIGSRHFADNPPVPLEQIVAMVNMDMVGRARDAKVYVGGYNSSKAFPEIIQAADKASPLILEDMGNDFASRSDHASFIAKNIPAVFFFTGLHEQYHAPTDDPPLINYEGMEQIAEMGYNVIRAIDSKTTEELAFNSPEPQEMLEGGNRGAAATPPGAAASPPREGAAQTAGGNPAAAERRARLGVMPDMGGNRTTGILVSGTTADSPAAKAGLKAGDILLKVGDREMKSIQDLQDVLVENTPGTKVKLLIERDGQQQEIEVTLE